LRLFIALNLPEATRDRIEALVRPLQALDLPVRWVAPAAYHLTLAFLGDVGADHVSEVEAAMALAATDQPRFSIGLGRVAVAPSSRRPRVLWLEVERSETLAALQGRLGRALDERGFASEARGFRPHVTLGRVRRRARTEDFAALPDAIATFDCVGAVAIDSVDLMQSELSAQGARYSVVARCELDERKSE
jgi:2'-5' RNA ligase